MPFMPAHSIPAPARMNSTTPRFFQRVKPPRFACVVFAVQPHRSSHSSVRRRSKSSAFGIQCQRDGSSTPSVCEIPSGAIFFAITFAVAGATKTNWLHSAQTDVVGCQPSLLLGIKIRDTGLRVRRRERAAGVIKWLAPEARPSVSNHSHGSSLRLLQKQTTRGGRRFVRGQSNPSTLQNNLAARSWLES